MRKVVFIWTLVLLSHGWAWGQSGPAVRIAVLHEPPYNFQNSRGQIDGYNVDYWRLWSNRTKTPIEVALAPNREAALQLLAEGRADAVAGVGKLPNDAPNLAFSTPFYHVRVTIFFHKDVVGVRSADDLVGIPTGVVRGAWAERFLSGVLGEGAALIPFDTHSDLFAALREERIPVFVAESRVASHFLTRLGLIQEYRYTGSALYEYPMHVVVRQEDEALLARIEKGIAEIRPSDIRRIERRWAGTGLWGQRAVHITLGIGGACVVFLLLAAAWNLALRRRIHKATSHLLDNQRALEESQEALRKSQRDLASTLDSIGDGVISTDCAGIITRMNPVAENLTGWPATEARGHPLHEVLKRYDSLTRLALPCPVERVLQEGVPLDFGRDTLLVCRDGRELHIADSGAPIRRPDTQVEGVVLVLRDVSEQKELEELYQQAQKMESLGRLAGGIAHDFNNLLSGIMGYADLLGQQLDANPRLRRHANAILDTARRASDLTQRLLTFARKGKTRSEPTDVHYLLDSVHSILCHTIHPHISLHKEFEAGKTIVIGDPALLQNAMLNLALNARDAMPDGGVLTLRTRNLTLDESFCERQTETITPGPYIQIEVKDTGVGIDRADLERIFDPFFTTKEPGEGTGLGLAACYGAMRNHHGLITVSSEKGKGSIFTLYLPLSQEETIPVRPVKPAAAKGAGRILVVDDEEIVREISKELLESLGYEVHVAQDGMQGIEYYLKDDSGFDLVLLDMMMPRMDGRETLAELKRVDPAARVVIASGFNLGMQTADLEVMGACGFIQKPFDRAELSFQVNSALTRAASTPRNGPGTAGQRQAPSVGEGVSGN